MDLAILVAASIEFQSLIGRFVMLHIDAFRKLINVSIPDRKVRNGNSISGRTSGVVSIPDRKVRNQQYQKGRNEHEVSIPDRKVRNRIRKKEIVYPHRFNP